MTQNRRAQSVDALPALVLASASPWRLELLRSAGLDVRGVAADVDEAAIQEVDPRQTAMARARAKAEAVGARVGSAALVVGADQVAHLDGESFGKPTDDASWLARLKQLRGQVHTLSTGVALLHQGACTTFAVDSRVRFRADLRDDELEAYVAHGEARGCAGGYMAEGRGAWLLEHVEGDWNNVIGLPLFALLGELRLRGFRLPTATRSETP